MSPRCTVRVTLNDVQGAAAEAIKSSLEPDNVNFPEGQSMHIAEAGGVLVLDFESVGSMRKLVGTIDEVLEHVQVALGAIEKC